MSDDIKLVNAGDVFDAESGEPLNVKAQKDVLAHLQAKYDVLPPDTVLVSPTDDSDVEDVQFNDPKMMGADVQDDIIDFIAGYPYTGLRWICRKLGLTPAEALKQILPNIMLVENCCWTPEEVKESLISEVESLTAEGWEPGVRPEPPTPEQLREKVSKHFKPELIIRMDCSAADLAYRSGSNLQDVLKAMVDIAVGHALSQFKYIDTDPSYESKWLLWPVEIAEAAANCQWIASARKCAAEAKEGK